MHIMMTTTVYTCAWQRHFDGNFVTQDDMGIIWALRNDAVIGSHKLSRSCLKCEMQLRGKASSETACNANADIQYCHTGMRLNSQ